MQEEGVNICNRQNTGRVQLPTPDTFAHIILLIHISFILRICMYVVLDQKRGQKLVLPRVAGLVGGKRLMYQRVAENKDSRLGGMSWIISTIVEP